MYTKLYRDVGFNRVYTIYELLDVYLETTGHRKYMGIEQFKDVLFENSVQNGGELAEVDDDVLQWCNEYVDYLYCNSEMSQSERDTAVKRIYDSATSVDRIMAGALFQLSMDDNERTRKLLSKLGKTLGKTMYGLCMWYVG